MAINLQGMLPSCCNIILQERSCWWRVSTRMSRIIPSYSPGQDLLIRISTRARGSETKAFLDTLFLKTNRGENQLNKCQRDRNPALQDLFPKPREVVQDPIRVWSDHRWRASLLPGSATRGAVFPHLSATYLLVANQLPPRVKRRPSHSMELGAPQPETGQPIQKKTGHAQEGAAKPV